MANDQQIILLQRYPGIGVLPIDIANHSEVDQTVREDNTGDTLFSFLWRELGDAESPEAAELLMSMALGDTKAVLEALEAADGSADPRRILLRSYPEIGGLPLDVEDEDSVNKLVASDKTGDTLFSFLWRELGDAEDLDSAVEMLGKAINDIEAVADAFASKVSIGR